MIISIIVLNVRLSFKLNWISAEDVDLILLPKSKERSNLKTCWISLWIRSKKEKNEKKDGSCFRRLSRFAPKELQITKNGMLLLILRTLMRSCLKRTQFFQRTILSFKWWKKIWMKGTKESKSRLELQIV